MQLSSQLSPVCTLYKSWFRLILAMVMIVIRLTLDRDMLCVCVSWLENYITMYDIFKWFDSLLLFFFSSLLQQSLFTVQLRSKFIWLTLQTSMKWHTKPRFVFEMLDQIQFFFFFVCHLWKHIYLWHTQRNRYNELHGSNYAHENITIQLLSCFLY